MWLLKPFLQLRLASFASGYPYLMLEKTASKAFLASREKVVARAAGIVQYRIVL